MPLGVLLQPVLNVRATDSVIHIPFGGTNEKA